MCEELRKFVKGITNVYNDSLLASIVAEVTGGKVLEDKDIDKMRLSDEDKEILK